MLRIISRAGTVLILALLVASCSKNSGTNAPASPPELLAPVFAGPNTTASNIGTQKADSVALVINLYAAVARSYMAGEPTQNGNTWTWTIHPSTNFTITWSATKQSDSSYTWTLAYDGPTDSITYNSWTYIKGTTSSDGKTGNWTVYYPNTQNNYMKYNWTTGGDGTLTGIGETYDTGGTMQQRVVMTNRTDKSGELDVYVGGGAILMFKSTWQSDGSGQWTAYDLTTGQTTTGSWS